MASDRDIEWRGVPAAVLALAWVATSAAGGFNAWGAAALAVALAASAAVAVQRLTIRGALLLATAVVLLLPLLALVLGLPLYYLFVGGPLVLLSVPAGLLAAWGAVRALRGHRGIPSPLA